MTTASCIGYVPAADRHLDEKQPREKKKAYFDLQFQGQSVRHDGKKFRQEPETGLTV